MHKHLMLFLLAEEITECFHNVVSFAFICCDSCLLGFGSTLFGTQATPLDPPFNSTINSKTPRDTEASNYKSFMLCYHRRPGSACSLDGKFQVQRTPPLFLC